MYKARLIKQTESVQQLLGEDSDEGGTQTPELILLDQFIQIHREKLEHQAQMLLVDEGIFQPEEIVIIILVELAVELERSLSQPVIPITISLTDSVPPSRALRPPSCSD